jgi:predicted dehydrogenase
MRMMSALATPLPVPLLARPRIGFAGLGWTGRRRLEAIATSGVADVVTVVDASPDAALEAVRTARGARVARSFDDLLSDELDGVVIATTNALNAALAQAALAHGLAVFCQKPLGRDRREVAAVVDSAHKADRLLMADVSFGRTAAAQILGDVVRSGELGEVFSVNLVFHSGHGPDKPWFYDRTLSGGGCLLDLGTHLLDLALWCLEFPRVDLVRARLCANGRPLAASPGAIEDFAAAQLTTASGAVLQLACSWHLSAGADAIVEVAFYGTRGGVVLRNLKGSLHDYTCERLEGTRRQTLTAPLDPWRGRAAVDWAERLARGERFDPQALRLVQVASLTDRIYGAA